MKKLIQSRSSAIKLIKQKILPIRIVANILLTSLIIGIIESIGILILAEIVKFIASLKSNFIYVLYLSMAGLTLVTLRYFFFSITVKNCERASQHLATKLMERIQYSSSFNLSKLSLKSVNSCGINDINAIFFGILLGIQTFSSSLIIIASVFIALLYLNPQSSWLVILISAIALIFLVPINNTTRIIGRKILHYQEEYAHMLRAIFATSDTSVVFKFDRTLLNGFTNINKKYKSAQGSNIKLTSAYKLISEASIFASTAAVTILALKSGKTFDIDTIIVYLLVLLRIQSPMMAFISSISSIRVHIPALLNYTEILNSLTTSKKIDPSNSSTKSDENLTNLAIYCNNAKVIIPIARNTEKQRELKYKNFTLKEGDKTCIYGESGSGKSTLLSIIAGNIPLSEGICLNYSRLTAYIPQASQFSMNTFEEELILYNRGNTLDTVYVNKLLKMLSLEERFPNVEYLLKARISQMSADISGGQAQRLNILRALSIKPSLLIADEPISSQDPENCMRVMKTITELSETLLVVSHQKEAQMYCSDRIDIRDLL